MKCRGERPRYIQTRWEEDTEQQRDLQRQQMAGLYDRLETWADGNGYLELPGTEISVRAGSYLWLYLALARYLRDRGQKAIPSATGGDRRILWDDAVSPTVQMRYVYPVMLALPYLVALMCGTGRKTENEKTETEIKQGQR